MHKDFSGHLTGAKHPTSTFLVPSDTPNMLTVIHHASNTLQISPSVQINFKIVALLNPTSQQTKLMCFLVTWCCYSHNITHNYTNYRYANDPNITNLFRDVKEYQIRIAGKRLQVEKYCVRKARSHHNQNNFLFYPAIEVTQLLRGYCRLATMLQLSCVATASLSHRLFTFFISGDDYLGFTRLT